MPTMFSFQGRADRGDWWTITLAGGLLAQVAAIVAFISIYQDGGSNRLVGGVSLLVVLPALWSTVAVTARRFRDLGMSPWLTLLMLVPLLGELGILIVCGFFPGTSSAKRTLVVRKVANGRDGYS